MELGVFVREAPLEGKKTVTLWRNYHQMGQQILTARGWKDFPLNSLERFPPDAIFVTEEDYSDRKESSRESSSRCPELYW